MNIKSVTIEGMHNVEKKTYEFDHVNYLFGHNGAGKSTVLQAVQLALLGYIPGMNKTKESIFSNSNSHTMAVTLVVQDSDTTITIRRVWTNSGKAINSTLYVSPDGYDIQSIVGNLELPIFNFNEFVSMTANKLKDWFIGFLPSTANKVNWNKELSDSVRAINVVDDKLIPDSVDAIESNGLTGVDQVRKANEYFKMLLSLKKQELSRVQSTIQSLVFYDNCDTDVTEGDISENIKQLNDERAELTKKLTVAENNVRIMERNSKIYTELSKLNLDSDCLEHDSKYFECKSKVEELSEQIDSYNKLIIDRSSARSDIEKKRLAAISERNIKNKVIESGGVCHYTNSKCESILTMIESIKSEVADIDKTVEKYNESIQKITAEINEANEKVYEFNDLKGSICLEMRDIENAYSKRDMLNRQIEITSEDNGSILIEDIVARIDEIDKSGADLSNTLVMVKANNRYNKLTESLSKDKFVIEQSIEALKLWDKLTGANGLQTKMMNEPFIKFVDKLNNYIKPLFGDDVSAKFNLIEKVNSFSFGIEKANRYIPYDLLSSGEKCMFMLSMMICIVDDSTANLKLIMIDDLFDHLDDINVNKLIEALYNVNNIQFIVAGVKAVANKECVIEVK